MRIESLILESHEIDSLYVFYVHTLGLHGKVSNDVLHVTLPNTSLKFIKSAEKRVYHFAFNITPNLIQQCADWLAELSPLMEYCGDSLVQFDDWNATSVYTLDPVGNIIEFIARRDLEANSSTTFSPIRDVLNISEIGARVESITFEFQTLQSIGLNRYSGSDHGFSAIGDTEELFIVVDDQKVCWFPTQKRVEVAPFKVQIAVNSNAYQVEFDGSFVVDDHHVIE